MVALRVRDLSFQYASGERALDRIDLDVDVGETRAIIGANGAGKSTFLLSLVGVLDAIGSVEVDGTVLSPRTYREVRRLVGLVFQDPDDQLFTPTVYDDVAFGPRNLGVPEPEIAQRVHDALGDVGLFHYDQRMPHHLSFGERKRVAIATVLSMEPQLLALDEPTSNLDPRARRRLIELLDSLPQTKVIATHDLPLVAELADSVSVFHRGRVLKTGPTIEVLTDTSLLDDAELEIDAHLLAQLESRPPRDADSDMDVSRV